ASSIEHPSPHPAPPTNPSIHQSTSPSFPLHPLQLGLHFLERRLRAGFLYEVPHLVGISLEVVKFIHSLQVHVLDVFPTFGPHRLPGGDARVLFLLEILGEK